MKKRTSLSLSSEMNLTNMIDVIFSILVVFMITAPLMSQGIKVELPKAQSASLQEKKSISVTITKDREIVLDDEVPTDQLGFRNDFRTLWTGNDETVVIINSDQNVPYGFVMQIVADAQQEGAAKFGFLTDPSSNAVSAVKSKKKKTTSR